MSHFDLCIIGSGSANSIVDERFDDLRIAQVEQGTFGGTCINVGCIPTKMFVYPADLAHTPDEASRLGVDLDLRTVRWPDIRDRIFGRIDQTSADGERYREKSSNVTLFRECARFVGLRRLQLDRSVITADRFVLGAGSRVVLPKLPGLESVPYHTSDTVMRLDFLPQTMIIIGGGYVAAEFAHIFSSYGTKVTLINRSDRLMRGEDADVAERFTEQLGRYVNLVTQNDPDRVESRPDGGITVYTSDVDGQPHEFHAEVLLVATGRRSNADTLNLEAIGVEVDESGFVVVDQYQRTAVPGIYALGDVSSHRQLKHVANRDARVVQHNLLHPDDLMRNDQRFIPHAVFSYPQIASVGITEQQAKADGVRYVTATVEYGSAAYGWAMEDVDHFVKLLADPADGRLLGAHLLGPQASVLIQPLLTAMSFGVPARELAYGQYWIHPALTEVVENALLALPLSDPDRDP
jgi:mycothione reductase